MCDSCTLHVQRIKYLEGVITRLKSKQSSEAEEEIPFQQIIAAVNDILGKKFKVSSTYKQFIRARWNEGHRKEDFEKVCRIKMGTWGRDPEMAIYLRPQTLFGTKMDAYLNEEDRSAKCTTPDWM